MEVVCLVVVTGVGIYVEVVVTLSLDADERVHVEVVVTGSVDANVELMSLLSGMDCEAVEAEAVDAGEAVESVVPGTPEEAALEAKPTLGARGQVLGPTLPGVVEVRRVGVRVLTLTWNAVAIAGRSGTVWKAAQRQNNASPNGQSWSLSR